MGRGSLKERSLKAQRGVLCSAHHGHEPRNLTADRRPGAAGSECPAPLRRAAPGDHGRAGAVPGRCRGSARRGRLRDRAVRCGAGLYPVGAGGHGAELQRAGGDPVDAGELVSAGRDAVGDGRGLRRISAAVRG